MRQHERLQAKADTHRNLALMFVAFAVNAVCILICAFQFEIYQAIMPAWLFLVVSLSFCFVQTIRWIDTRKSADLSRIFDMEDRAR